MVLVCATATSKSTPATIRPIPAALRKRYVLRSRNRAKGLVRIAPEIRNLVEIRRYNLAHPASKLRERFDIVFCRNVMIYFDRPTQLQVAATLARQLNAGGFLFVVTRKL